jgi:transcriptional regulator with PAS, ATPase and Fis domain
MDNDKFNEQEILWQSLEYFDSVESQPIALKDRVELLERDCINNALEIYDGNRTKAAKHLNMGRTLLIHKIKKLDL